jgi:hypothetical protein
MIVPMWIHSMRRLVLLLLAASAMPAQEPWPNVAALKPGTAITVWEKSGARHKGEFDSVVRAQMANAVQDLVALRYDGRKIDLAQEKVSRIQDRSRGHRLRNMLIGAGIGLVGGVILDKTAGTRFFNEGRDIRAPLYIAPIAIGAGIGALIPSHPTVYRAR